MTFSGLCLDIFDMVDSPVVSVTRDSPIILRTPDGDIELDILMKREDEDEICIFPRTADWNNKMRRIARRRNEPEPDLF